jgi:uncharacterized membrane protein
MEYHDFFLLHALFLSLIFIITSQLKLYEEKVIDKNVKPLSIFHASNVLVQQQYQEKEFKKYSDLISYLIVVAQSNELLMKNHEFVYDRNHDHEFVHSDCVLR